MAVSKKFAELSPETTRRLRMLFAESDWAQAGKLLTEDCGRNLPFLENQSPVELERYRFAAMKLSQGSLARLQDAIALAKTDWRDLLMSADFGHDVDAHRFWEP